MMIKVVYFVCFIRQKIDRKRRKSCVFQKILIVLKKKFVVDGGCGYLISKSQICCDCFYYQREIKATFTILLRSNYIENANIKDRRLMRLIPLSKILILRHTIKINMNQLHLMNSFSSNQTFCKLLITFVKKTAQIQMPFMRPEKNRSIKY